MAMAMATQQALHLPSLSCTFSLATSSSSLPSSLRYPCLDLKPRSSYFCSHSLHLGFRGLDNGLSAHDQTRALQVGRVVASDATTMEAEADDGVEYTTAEALTMYIRMEGTLGATTGARVSKILEAMEGVSNVKVSLEEGMATVELTKKTNIQATGVASELVDAVQKAGFKVQSLCLGFDDEETSEDDALYFGSSSAMDEAEIAAI